MSTHATIARENYDGTVDTIYCHFDGYLSHVGRVLLEHYADPFKIDHLIDLGNISCLGYTTDSQPPAVLAPDQFPAMDRNYTIAYERDKDEDDQQAITFTDMESFLNYDDASHYTYVKRSDKKWWVRLGRRGPLQLLTQELITQPEDQECIE